MWNPECGVLCNESWQPTPVTYSNAEPGVWSAVTTEPCYLVSQSEMNTAIVQFLQHTPGLYSGHVGHRDLVDGQNLVSGPQLTVLLGTTTCENLLNRQRLISKRGVFASFQ
uniref:Uncharacterized protein n=1 Tax=Cacopsylla melanoneura TaxID=428564 RepID=A0A8D8RX12_9HEMI